MCMHVLVERESDRHLASFYQFGRNLENLRIWESLSILPVSSPVCHLIWIWTEALFADSVTVGLFVVICCCLCAVPVLSYLSFPTNSYLSHCFGMASSLLLSDGFQFGKTSIYSFLPKTNQSLTNLYMPFLLSYLFFVCVYAGAKFLPPSFISFFVECRFHFLVYICMFDISFSILSL